MIDGSELGGSDVKKYRFFIKRRNNKSFDRDLIQKTVGGLVPSHHTVDFKKAHVSILINVIAGLTLLSITDKFDVSITLLLCVGCVGS